MAVKKYRVYLEQSETGILEIEAESAEEATSSALRKCALQEDAGWSDDPQFLAYETVEIDENGDELDATRVYA